MSNKFTEQSGAVLEPAKVSISEDGEQITIDRNARTLATAKKLSDFVNSLECLTSEQNNTLIELMLEHLREAEIGAFLAGANIAAGVAGADSQPNAAPNFKILH